MSLASIGDLDVIFDARHAGDVADALDGDLTQEERWQSPSHDHHAAIDVDPEQAMRKMIPLMKAADDLLFQQRVVFR